MAINHAVNKPAIVKHLYQGMGIPAKNPIPPTMWGYDDGIEDYIYNPEKSKQLLAEAGYPDGFATTLWALPVPRPYIPDGRALAEVVQSDLRRVGIEAKIVTFDWGTYLEKTKHGEHDIAMLGVVRRPRRSGQLLLLPVKQVGRRKAGGQYRFLSERRHAGYPQSGADHHRPRKAN